jgi:hypothetical protein
LEYRLEAQQYSVRQKHLRRAQPERIVSGKFYHPAVVRGNHNIPMIIGMEAFMKKQSEQITEQIKKT